jgi:trimeric autotransporter adhesin
MLQPVRSSTLRMGIVILSLCLVLSAIAVPCLAITLTPGAQSGSATIANGDPVIIHGVATGQPRNGLQVWLVGYNTVKITNVAVNSDDSYTYELKSADTMNLASGQYLVIVQHPMMNGQFDIVYSSSTGQVINRQLGSSGSAIFQLTSGGSLQSTDAASALMRAINSQNIDDTFATASFYVSPPDAFIHPIGDHAVGDKFTITGSTNLAVGDQLQVEVYSSSFAPTSKNQPSGFSGASGVVQVQPGSDGRNQWSFDIDSSSFKPDEYIVTVTGILQDVRGSSTFNIVQALPATSQPTPAPEVTTIVTTATTPVSPTAEPTTKKSSLIPWCGAAALFCAAAFIGLKKEDR